MQSEIITDTPAAQTSVAMSIFSGIFNFGIGTGALIGGLVCTHLSISFIGIAGGLIVLLALPTGNLLLSGGHFDRLSDRFGCWPATFPVAELVEATARVL